MGYRTIVWNSGNLNGLDPVTGGHFLAASNPKAAGIPYKTVVHGGSARFAVSAPAEASVRVAVYDVAGRLVRILLDGRLPESETTVTWDLADRSGRRVTGGIYFVRLTGGETVGRKLVVLP
jgi:hypothetical protein